MVCWAAAVAAKKAAAAARAMSVIRIGSPRCASPDKLFARGREGVNARCPLLGQRKTPCRGQPVECSHPVPSPCYPANRLFLATAAVRVDIDAADTLAYRH